MKKRLSIGTIVPLFSLFIFQTVLAQVTGEVTSLHPKDGAQLCIHQYEKAVAIAEIRNHYREEAIRGRLVVEVWKRVTSNHAEMIDQKIKLVVLDVEQSAVLSVSCAENLPKGFYRAKAWLQWQRISDDIHTGIWHNLAIPTPTKISIGGKSIIDNNTDHLFVIGPCEFELPEGLENSK